MRLVCRQVLYTFVAFVLLGGCESQPTPEPAVPTFSKDVAPIVIRSCAPCHRPGGAAPFALISYDDVRRRSGQIADVTATRYMPPWLPEPGYGNFDGARVLSAAEVDVLKRWDEADAPEGNPEELPPLPAWVEGWELGEPDLVVEMSEPFELPAEGGDVFRNFVLPVPLNESRSVEALEFRPSDRRLVHHATITIDPTRSSRRLDVRDPGPGFDGMRTAPGAVMPDGHFLGWTPGKSPHREPEGMSWRLERKSDLVVQLHMPTTGKPERVQASLGLFFTAHVPRLVPVMMRLGSRRMDIPAGTNDYKVEDVYVLPVDVNALSVYPHAHYLAREMKAKAIHPDGSETWLLYIREWDFNWQEYYRYREPIFLPKGTRLTMEYTYDNSEDNPRNPHRPPKHVTYGPQTDDEMGDLYIQVLPLRVEELDVLRSDFTEKDLNASIRDLTFRVERNPRDAEAWNSLGFTYEALGRTDEAIQSFREAIRIRPDLEEGHFNLGTLLAARGARTEAIGHFESVLRSDPDCVDCRVRLGNVLRDQGKLDQAVAQLERATRLDAEHPWAQYSLGISLQLRGQLAEAISQYRKVVRLDPENVDARISLGSALTASGQCAQAVLELERAMRLEPGWPEPKARLAYALIQCPHSSPDALERALAFASEAAQMTRFQDASVLDTLGDALVASGRREDGREAWRAAVALAQRDGNVDLIEELRGKLSRR